MFNVGDRVKWGKVGGYSWMDIDRDFYGVVTGVSRSGDTLKVTVEDYDPSPLYRRGVYARPSQVSKVEPFSLENK